MQKDASNFVFDFVVCPIRMLAAQEGCFMSPHCPVKPVSRVPTLLRRHAPQDFDLLGAGVFVRKHGSEGVLACNPVRGCLIIETTVVLPDFLFVFRRREMRKPVKPATRLRLGGRVETAEPRRRKTKRKLSLGPRFSTNRQPLTGFSGRVPALCFLCSLLFISYFIQANSSLSPTLHRASRLLCHPREHYPVVHRLCRRQSARWSE